MFKKTLFITFFVFLAGLFVYLGGAEEGMDMQKTMPKTKMEKSLDKNKESDKEREKDRGTWENLKRDHLPYYKERKTPQGFWVRKGTDFFELFLLITCSTLIALSLEISGVLGLIALVLWPLLRFARLSEHSALAFMSSVRNGSVGNGILMSAKDGGAIDKRELWCSVLIVSAIATLGHMPSYILAIGAVCGHEALLAVASVRIGAVMAQILVILLVARLLVRGTQASSYQRPKLEFYEGSLKHFFKKLFSKFTKTFKRMALYLTPAYFLVALAEFNGLFDQAFDYLTSKFDLSFLPAQASVILPAQFGSIHSALGMVRSFLEEGSLNPKQAVIILLVGTILTAPIRTIKRIMPTYVALLGPQGGLILGILAQVLRMGFLMVALIIMYFIW